MNNNADRLTAYLPSWLRWALLLTLGGLVAGFSIAFFFGVNQPGFKDWLPASVSVVQIALTALAYVLLLFFTESGQSPAALEQRTEQILTKLLPETLARITDVQGHSIKVVVGSRSGVVGHDYTLRSPNAELRFWIGLNVHRVIVILWSTWPEGLSGSELKKKLETSFKGTVTGACRVGYDEALFAAENIEGRNFGSIWLTWDLGTNEDFLTHSPTQLFFAQDTALMMQSFLRSAQRSQIQLSINQAPMPL